MRLIQILFVVMLLSMAGTATRDTDLIRAESPIAKDLGALTLSEIRAIFANDGWFAGNLGSAGYTPSQNAFLRDDPDAGTPMGQSREPLRLGAVNWNTRPALGV